MIYAAFDRGAREAAASDVFQYDTGQALVLSGLPADLGGVTVEVHFGFDKDEKAEARIASYDRKAGTWQAEVPDVYLRRSRTVNAFVYVIETELRRRTLYQVTFTPIERPAPSTEVTPAQRDAWAELVIEVNTAIAGADAAASRANAAAAGVSDAIGDLDADKAAWETRVQAAEADAAAAKSTAQAARTTANTAKTTATNASTAAAAAKTAAQTAQSRADAAYALATGALYYAVEKSITLGTGGWTYNGTYDRYEKNFTVSGMTAAMDVSLTYSAAGQSCPIIGAVSYAGGVTVYAADVPTVSATATVKGIAERA